MYFCAEFITIPNMKQIFFLLTILLFKGATAQYAKSELSKHSHAIEQSQRKGSIIISLDTLFEKGTPVGLIKMVGEKSMSIRNLEGTELVFVREAERKERSLYTFNGNLAKAFQCETRGAYWSEPENYCKTLLEKGVILNGQLIPEKVGIFIKENGILSSAQQTHFDMVEDSRKYGRIAVSMDTIFQKGERFGIIKKVGADAISVRNLEDKELIYIKKESYKGVEDLVFNTNGQYYSVFLFHSLNKQADVDNYIWGLKGYAEIVINAGLIQGNELDEAAVDRFVLANGMKATQKRENSELSSIFGKTSNNSNENKTSTTTNSGTGYVTRNKNASISLNYDKIEQDFKVIGVVKRSTGMSMSGSKINVIAITFPNGTGVAEAQSELSNDTEWNIMTAKDGKQHHITISIKGMEVEEIARFLIVNNYL